MSSEKLDERLGLDGPRDELQELAETFDAMLARLEQAFAAQRRFVADASHELRTPLTLARTEAEVALSDPGASAATLREALDHVRRSMERGGALVDALLRLARTDTAAPLTEEVELSVLLVAAAKEARSDGRADGITLTVISDVSLRARGDATLLRAMIDNLLTNAIAYNGSRVAGSGRYFRMRQARRRSPSPTPVVSSLRILSIPCSSRLSEPSHRAHDAPAAQA